MDIVIILVRNFPMAVPRLFQRMQTLFRHFGDEPVVCAQPQGEEVLPPDRGPVFVGGRIHRLHHEVGAPLARYPVVFSCGSVLRRIFLMVLVPRLVPVRKPRPQRQTSLIQKTAMQNLLVVFFFSCHDLAVRVTPMFRVVRHGARSFHTVCCSDFAHRDRALDFGERVATLVSLLRDQPTLSIPVVIMSILVSARSIMEVLLLVQVLWVQFRENTIFLVFMEDRKLYRLCSYATSSIRHTHGKIMLPPCDLWHNRSRARWRHHVFLRAYRRAMT